jgi:enoyl-CoA hydratase
VNEAKELLKDWPATDVVRLLLNRPDRLNAIDASLAHALLEAFDSVDARAVILGSSTPQAFCSGADLDLGDAERATVSDLLYELYEKMVKLPVPIIVTVDGYAVGGGVQLAVAGDLRIVGPEAKMRVAGPGHGLAVAGWGLPSLVGRGRALDLCLTMRAVGAEEALAMGLADRMEQDPAGAAVDLAGAFARLDPAAVGRTKRVVSGASGILDALREERTGNRESWSGSVAALSLRRERGRG